MATYRYYVVEHAFVVRYDERSRTAERLTGDGTWVAYPGVWDLWANGRELADEAAALAKHRQLMDDG